jgi:diguanylate cyclase (GGDEF)-like protein/PAS domain S-box-containing protein
MDENINSRDMLLEVERLRKGLHNLTQAQNDNLIYKQQLDAIMDNAPVEVYFKDREGRYIKINKQFEKLFGVKNEDLIGMLPDAAHEPKLAASSRDQDLSVLNSGKAEWREEIVEIVNGDHPRTLLTIKFPVFDGDGEVDGLGAIVTDITAKVNSEDKLKKSHILFNKAEKIAKLGYWEWDEIASRYISCSEQYASIHDMTVEQMIDEPISYETSRKFICESDRKRYIQVVDSARESKIGWIIEYRSIDKSGKSVYLHEIGEPVLDDYGLMIKTVGTRQDITEKKLAEQELQQSHSLFHQAEAMGNMGRWSWDLVEDKLIYCSDQFARIYGMTVPEALDYFISTEAEIDIIHPDDKERFNQEQYDPNGLHDSLDIEYRIINPSGDIRHVYTRSELVFGNNGAPSQSFGTIQDITESKQVDRKLERIAHYDLLTDLPNRVLLADRLSQAMMQCQRRNQSLAVACMDLDGFKAVNDTYGHDVGDRLLVALSKRMKVALREGDTLARIGGDEFIAIMVDLENIKDSEPVLKRLLKAAAEPVSVGDAVLQVSASIGVTLYPQDSVDADLLIRHADGAMHVAKHAGKNRYYLFDTTLDREIKIRQASIDDVSAALARCEFVLHYQPKVNMHTGEVIGAEALIRWQHPIRGLVPPLDFLPAIEGHAISLELGEWVIDTALSQISQWQNMAIDLPISVNISAYQLQQRNFATRLAALLAAHPEVSPHYLELEILETSELSDINQVFDTMNTCHDLGVRFALDDFGTGYSSLVHLRRLPAYLIKIDQSFVRDMLEDADDLAIVEGVASLAKAFQREVIAEGVETIQHGVALLQLGCDLAQGYGIARPMPSDDIPEWVSNWKADDSWLAKSPIE